MTSTLISSKMVIIYYEGKVPRLIRGVGTYRNGRKKPDKYVKTIRYITATADEREKDARCDKEGSLLGYHKADRADNKSKAIAKATTDYNHKRLNKSKTGNIKLESKMQDKLDREWAEAKRLEYEAEQKKIKNIKNMIKTGGVKRIKKKKHHKKLPPPEITNQD